MLTDKEIRAHRDDLLKLVQRPCVCTEPIQQLACRAKAMHYWHMAMMLSWAMGEDPEYDRTVEQVAKMVRT